MWRSGTEFRAKSAFHFVTEFLQRSGTEFRAESAFRFVKWNFLKKIWRSAAKYISNVLSAS